MLLVLPLPESGDDCFPKFDVEEERGSWFSLVEAVESAAALAGFRGAEYLPSLGLAALGAEGGG